MSKNNINKKICMIAIAPYPGDPRIRREAEALEKDGYEIDIICRYSQSSNQIPKQKYGKITAYRIMKAPSQESMIKYSVQSILFIAAAFLRLNLMYFKKRYSIVQVHNLPDYLIFTGAFLKLFGVKLILDIHDPSVDLFEEKWPGKSKGIFKSLIKISERYSCKLSDHLITVTSICKEKLVERGNSPEKISLVLNTANENIFKFNENRNYLKITERAKILYYGTIADRQGLHNAVEAMAYFLKVIPNSTLNIFGKYELSYKNKLEKLIKELNLGNNVILNGVINRDQILSIINQHDIGIVPHPCTEYTNLSLPTKAFEYITSGLPTVSTKLTSLSRILNDDCITYVEDGNPEAFSEAIKNLCLKPELRKSKTFKAYDAIKEISGQVMNRRYVDLIEQMIK